MINLLPAELLFDRLQFPFLEQISAFFLILYPWSPQRGNDIVSVISFLLNSELTESL